MRAVIKTYENREGINFVVSTKEARILTTAEVVELIHTALKIRVGETFTEAIAFERANNIAQTFTFDGAVAIFGD